jgi:hypothetical protein
MRTRTHLGMSPSGSLGIRIFQCVEKPTPFFTPVYSLFFLKTSRGGGEDFVTLVLTLARINAAGGRY